MFDAIQIFGGDFKKVLTSVCILFGKFRGSFKKYHILMLNMSINSYQQLL